jgi:hypothetical protein
MAAAVAAALGPKGEVMVAAVAAAVAAFGVVAEAAAAATAEEEVRGVERGAGEVEA